ncbi:MAG: NADH-quinone oxidoreductase subunit A [SAR324 cluster bacterium]|nr:NADH-quinone oxidoreductase subunit A [SAR324 cluster bacterium]
MLEHVTLADYLPIALMLVLAGLFVVGSLVASRFVRPDRPTPEKLDPYECGIVPEVEPIQRFPVKFYLVAMLFVIFDVETVFMFPWAVIMDELALFGKSGRLEEVFNEILERAACHGAIRAGMALSREEMEALVSQLEGLDVNLYCPHGRPVWVEIPLRELEKRFKRIV